MVASQKAFKQHSIFPTVELALPSRLGFEKVARSAAAAFAEQVGVSLERIEDLKTAVSEACMNAAVHGNRGEMETMVQVTMRAHDRLLEVIVCDDGISAIPESLPEPGLSDGHGGWGLFFIDQLMDSVSLQRMPDGGNQVSMTLNLFH